MTTIAEVYDNVGPPFDDPEADVVIRSKASHKDFLVTRIFLALASPVFRTMFTLPQGEALETETKDGRPVVPLDEDEETVDALLRLAYPHATRGPLFSNLEGIAKILRAAIKYDMQGVEKLVREELVAPRFTDSEPVRVFALACRLGLEPEARIAAKKTLRLPILGREYIQELEHITAGTLHRLFEYQLECGKLASTVADVATNFEWITNDKFVWFDCGECHKHNGYSNISVLISGNRRKWVFSKWWLDFMAEAKAALLDRPSGATVIDSDMVDKAVTCAIVQCTVCRPRVLKEMREFCDAFAAEVEKVTKEVSDICCWIKIILIVEGRVEYSTLTSSLTPICGCYALSCQSHFTSSLTRSGTPVFPGQSSPYCSSK